MIFVFLKTCTAVGLPWLMATVREVAVRVNTSSDSGPSLGLGGVVFAMRCLRGLVLNRERIKCRLRDPSGTTVLAKHPVQYCIHLRLFVQRTRVDREIVCVLTRVGCKRLR